jgi:hypothetical protein
MPSRHAVPLGLSPDGSDLLSVDGQGVPPSTGGSQRRLGDLSGETGAWSPDGRMIAYARHNELLMADAAGSGSRKLSSIEGDINSIVWSPDGTRLRFDRSQTVGQHELWEVSIDGNNLHRLLAGWHNPPDECCGRWTADGEYFVFQSANQVWALPKVSFLRNSPAPIQLTASPMSLSTPIPSKDGKKLFVIGEVHRGELMRYDLKTHQFIPLLRRFLPSTLRSRKTVSGSRMSLIPRVLCGVPKWMAAIACSLHIDRCIPCCRAGHLTASKSCSSSSNAAQTIAGVCRVSRRGHSAGAHSK